MTIEEGKISDWHNIDYKYPKPLEQPVKANLCDVYRRTHSKPYIKHSYLLKPQGY
jgi:hypothetical protein